MAVASFAAGSEQGEDGLIRPLEAFEEFLSLKSAGGQAVADH